MPLNAFDSGCRFLNYRPHTTKELRDKLLKKGFDADDISQTIKRLSELGYLNDENVAIRCVESGLKEKHWGSSKITAYLIKKGVDREIIKKILNKFLEDISEEDIARQALKKKLGENYTSYPARKTGFFLNSRGFPPEVIYKIIRETEQRD